MEHTAKNRRARETSEAESATCKFKKVRLPNLSLSAKDVDALIHSLEARSASHSGPQRTKSRRPSAVESVAPPRDVGIGERMSDEVFEEVALVLKMTRSATNARQCGLRMVVEARRAREAEERLTTELSHVSRRSLEEEAG
jgi:hypothetical protein